MIVNLKDVIELEYGTQLAAAQAMTLPKEKTFFNAGNLSNLIYNEKGYKATLRRPTYDRIKKAFPKYNHRWILHDELPKYNTEKKEDFLCEPESVYKPIEKPNTNQYMKDYSDKLIPLLLKNIEDLQEKVSVLENRVANYEVTPKANVGS